MATKQELEWLQKLASQYGWADSQQFKDYVNQNAWTWTYDKLMAWLKNQASVQTAPAPTSMIDTTTGQEVQQPIQNQPITTPTPTQVPNIPQPIQETPKPQIQAPKVEVKTDINEAINPKWQQWVDKALESWQNVKAKLDEWFKAWTIDQTTYNQASNYLQQKEQGKVGEQARLEEEQRKMQLDPNNLFNLIRTGQTATQEIKNTLEYKRQQERASNLSKFENMSPSNLSYELQNGWLYMWTETYNDLKQLNPKLIQQAEQLMSLNLERIMW